MAYDAEGNWITGDPTETAGILEGIYQEPEDLTKEPLPTYTGYDAAKAGEDIQQNVNIKEGSSYITPQATVSGQMQQLLSRESPYIKQARLQSGEASQERGLLNTSMAAGAGQAAAIQSALPIAQQDAQMYGEVARAQQTADYGIEGIKSEAIVSGEITKQQAAVNQQNTNVNNAFQAAIKGADATSSVYLQDMQNSYNTGVQHLEMTNATLLQQMQLDSATSEQVRTASSQILQNYQVSVENMMQDPDFLAMGEEAVQNALDSTLSLATNSIKFIGNSAGVEVDSWIDEYITGLSIGPYE